MPKIVIALGGNALGDTPQQQLELIRGTAKAIADLVEGGNDVIIAHGNGPQVGMINLAMSTAAEAAQKKRHAVSRMRGDESGIYRLSPAKRHPQRAAKPRHTKKRCYACDTGCG